MIAVLPSSTVTCLRSGQTLSSPSSVVKELLENALDASATCVDVRMDNFGLDCIVVKDNGCGVQRHEMPLMAAPNATSKISAFDDLATDRLRTYGFRGQGLNCICNLARVQIVSKSCGQQAGTSMTFDRAGRPVDELTTLVACTVGTTVTVSNLFDSLPVRRSYYAKSPARCEEDFRKVKHWICSYALIRPAVRISLTHNKKPVFVKPACLDLVESAKYVFGMELFSCLLSATHDQVLGRDVSVEQLLPKNDADAMRKSCQAVDKTFVFVNERPVRDKKLESVLRRCALETIGVNKVPASVVALRIAPELVDVNLEPSKDSILIRGHEELFLCLTDKWLSDYSFAQTALPDRGNGSAPDTADQLKVPACKGEADDRVTPSWRKGTLVTDQRGCVVEPVNLAPCKSGFQTRRSSAKPDTPVDSITTEIPYDELRHGSVKPDSLIGCVTTEGPYGDQRLVGQHLLPNNTDFFLLSKSDKGRQYMRSAPADQVNSQGEAKLPYVDVADRASGAITARRATPFSQKSSQRHSKSADVRRSSGNKSLLDFGFSTSEPHSRSPPVGAALLEPGQPYPGPTMTDGKEAGITVAKTITMNDHTLLKHPNISLPGLRGHSTMHLLPDDQPEPPAKKSKVDDLLPTQQLQSSSWNSLRFTVPLSFRLSRLCKTPPKSVPASNLGVNSLVGQVQGWWIKTSTEASGRQHLDLVNHFGLRELHIYDRLMQKTELRPCATSMSAADMASDKNWSPSLTQLLLMLSNYREGPVSDARLEMNGIVICFDEHERPILSGAPAVSNALLGVPDVVEILSQIQKDFNVPVGQCRPAKVADYFRTECRRMVRESAPGISRLEAQELLDFESSQASDVQWCPHAKPLWVRLWTAPLNSSGDRPSHEFRNTLP